MPFSNRTKAETMLLVWAMVALAHPIAHAGKSAGATEPLSAQTVRIQIMEGQSEILFHCPETTIVRAKGAKSSAIPPGTYRIVAEKVQPARQRFHLFSKTFKPNEVAEERAYMETWRARGYRPERVVIGKRLETEAGRILDARVHWISIVQSVTEAEAETLQAKLKAQEQWTWMRGEIIEPGRGQLTVFDAGGKALIRSRTLPMSFVSDTPITVDNVDSGFWETKQGRLSYQGMLSITIGPDGKLALSEQLPVEDYLEGVLPAEMPPLWPAEALKAQAVAARSEVLVNLATKHRLEGFDFCAIEHCRAYLGAGGRDERTSAAVRATRGEILVQGGRIIPAVFASNCGGWTENNETAWRAPEDAALRGVSDLASGTAGPPPKDRGVSEWLHNAPKAYCSGDATYFRWRRSFSQRELSALVNKRYAVGTVKSIQLGDRGVSGRLKWVRVTGTKKTETIHKELPIRQAFGGLPSALFVIETARGSRGAPAFTFVGGGRGHGVGLCQHGTRGRVEAGFVYTEVLTHYFSKVLVQRYR